MDDKDWNKLAAIIRKRRFQDIPDESWDLIADKIGCRKRGRPRKDELPKEPQLIRFLIENLDTKVNDRRIRVFKQYTSLRELNMKSFDALYQIAEEEGVSDKTIDADLTYYRKNKEYIHLIKAATLPALIGVMSAVYGGDILNGKIFADEKDNPFT
jgi:hypothetical protein